MQNVGKQYYGHIDLNAIENSYTQAFLFIKEYCNSNRLEHARILEVGCSSGYFSEFLRSHGMQVYGVEPFSTEAFDNNRLDGFYNGTVELFCAEKYQELQSSFDVIVLGDVIEHLVDPEQALKSLSGFLKEDGVFVASVPNITHKGIQNMIKDGQWIYQKYGLLDSTHLRFFSWRSLRELFIKVGFGIDRRHDICMPDAWIYPLGHARYKVFTDTVKRFAKKILPKHVATCIKHVLKKYASALSSVFELVVTRGKSTDTVFQFVLRASRASLSRHAFTDDLPKNLLVVSSAPTSSLADIRLKIPLELYAKQFGGIVTIKHFETVTDNDINSADVLIVHREISMSTINILRKAYKLGMSVIYDTDDNLFRLPEYSTNTLSPFDIWLMEYVISIADKVTCTVLPLKRELEKYSDNVCIVPNIVHADETAFSVQEKQNGSSCTLVAASSDTIPTDFLEEALSIVCQKANTVEIVAIGAIAKRFAHLPCKVTQFKSCSSEEFSKIIGSFKNGIGLIPLEDSYFSSCKSPIKYFHYTSAGVVTIASDVQPYSDCINEENGVLVENDPLIWAQTIMDIVNDIPRRQQILTGALKTWKSMGSANAAVEAWHNVFRNLPKPYSKY